MNDALPGRFAAFGLFLNAWAPLWSMDLAFLENPHCLSVLNCIILEPFNILPHL